MRAEWGRVIRRWNEIPSGRDDYVFGAGGRLWHDFAMGAHPFNVKFDGLTNEALSLFPRISGRDAAWEVGNVCCVAVCRFFNYHRILHFFSPACFKTLFRVPGGRSLEGWPDTVTVPAFVG